MIFVNLSAITSKPFVRFARARVDFDAAAVTEVFGDTMCFRWLEDGATNADVPRAVGGKRDGAMER